LPRSTWPHIALTGLLNRRGFLARVESAGDGTIALIDLDKFKSVNDSFGHDVGDAILQDFAAFLARGVRKADCVGRWGGEEFAVFFPATEEGEAAGILQRLCRRLANGLIERPDGAPMTCSGGIVALDGEPLQLAMARADAALYAAKRSGRNQLRVGDRHILAD
jgi:diguanylate cyclase (GGDEF)-like protein